MWQETTCSCDVKVKLNIRIKTKPFWLALQIVCSSKTPLFVKKYVYDVGKKKTKKLKNNYLPSGKSRRPFSTFHLMRREVFQRRTPANSSFVVFLRFWTCGIVESKTTTSAKTFTTHCTDVVKIFLRNSFFMLIFFFIMTSCLTSLQCQIRPLFKKTKRPKIIWNRNLWCVNKEAVRH